MKIRAKPQLSQREKDERKFVRNAQKWVDMGITQEEGKPWKNVKYITIFDKLRLKIYPIKESYYGPSFKKQILVIETIVAWWELKDKPEMTIYITWGREFYTHFGITPSR